ncbi:MAG: hypothetical protein JXX14_20185 [Deltaproteobacteria bacterium]|nr:hypothetical protein [Deltaproteobacteria bacterium]
MKSNSNVQNVSQPKPRLSFDSVASNLAEIRTQVTDFGSVLQKIVDEMQNVPDARAVDAFKQQVLQKQMVLETLVEENSCTLEILKHDVVALTADVHELKSQMREVRDAYKTGVELLPPVNIRGTTLDAISALRRHPLSSIPPRQLSEGEAIRFLKAIDEIVTASDVCECLKTSASGE